MECEQRVTCVGDSDWGILALVLYLASEPWMPEHETEYWCLLKSEDAMFFLCRADPLLKHVM